MSISYDTGSALTHARKLAELGVPVFAGRLDREGNPDGRDPRWKNWQNTRPNSRPIDRWATGEALGAVTGVRFDVIDVDPRNGGMDSLRKMAADLGDDGPDEYWRVATASGGRHIWIAPLGLGGHNSFMPGLDLKAAGGFVFIPPTVRPSKDPRNLGELVAYRPLSELIVPVGKDDTGGPIRDYITECLAKREGRGTGSGRNRLTDLEQACLDAPRGEQHDALLALVTELCRKSDDDEYVVYRAWKVAQQMQAFVRHRPWRESDVRGLLYKDGRRPIADAVGEELRDLLELNAGSGPMSASAAVVGLKPLGRVAREKIRWAWKPYLAFGDASINDSFAGVGKSLTALDVASRFTTGRPMPGEAEAIAPAGNVLLLAPEDRESVLLARVEAAGGDTSRIFIPSGVEVKATPGRRGKTKERAYLGGHLITFPTSVEQFHKWIKSYRIGLVVIDPIAAFLDPDINSNNDASVRRALEPFALVLGMETCGAWLIRHFNKDSKQSASMRGGGSVAFGAVARTHMISGELPEDLPTEATHAISLVKTNNVRRRKGYALGYVIEDSSIEADDQGGFVPRVRWVGEVKVDLDELAGKPRKGPAPTIQTDWREMLDKLFASSDCVLASDVREAAAAAGLAWDNKTFDKVTERMGIRKFSVGKPGGGSVHYWTTRKARVSEKGEKRVGAR